MRQPLLIGGENIPPLDHRRMTDLRSFLMSARGAHSWAPRSFVLDKSPACRGSRCGGKNGQN
ncbi:MAG TPA: hypothetical protein VFS01_08095, partial [Rhizomicrobium sp.]|nr:hypothetical protein [Rhizomicrobium sp.]